jgi:hypothetical protein
MPRGSKLTGLRKRLTDLAVSLRPPLSDESWLGQRSLDEEGLNIESVIADVLGPLNLPSLREDTNEGEPTGRRWTGKPAVMGSTSTSARPSGSNQYGPPVGAVISSASGGINVWPGSRPMACAEILLVFLLPRRHVPEGVSYALRHLTSYCPDRTFGVLFAARQWDPGLWTLYEPAFKRLSEAGPVREILLQYRGQPERWLS